MYVPMNYLSVCSGIEAATVAWQHLGWNPLGFSEIEKFPAQVLATHYPLTPNMGDMTNYKQWRIDEPVNLIVGGTPCQSFSVAGLRKGLEDPRGNLALTYVGLLDHLKPEWFIWENVPGVLSSNHGQDFSAFLSALAYIGYGFAYRVLDAQYFGVPQRRRRVFVVGCARGWQYPAKVLFEPSCLSGDLTKGRKKREETSRTSIPSVANTLQTTCNDYSRADGFNMIAYEWHNQDSRIKPINVAATLNCNAGGREGHLVQAVYENHPSDSRVKEMGEVCQTVTSTWGSGGGNVPFVQQAVAIQDTSGRDKAQNGKGWNEEVSYTLDATGLQGVSYAFEPSIAKREGNPSRFNENISPTLRADMGDNQVAVACLGGQHPNAAVGENISPTLTNAMGAGGGHIPIIGNMAVRRLTPTECERLQGFPDGYTDIKPNGKQTPDGPRYKALGNSMAVPVMRWIGERINKLVALNKLM
jgi:DNA (cytosine-5)-methyltransferase 1